MERERERERVPSRDGERESCFKRWKERERESCFKRWRDRLI